MIVFIVKMEKASISLFTVSLNQEKNFSKKLLIELKTIPF